jgi:hypothetical protein
MTVNKLMRSIAISAAILLATVGGAGSAFASINEATARAPWTLVLMSPTTSPRPFKSTDGRWYLVYEVELTNYITQPVAIKQFQVVDANDPKHVVLTLSGKDLDEVFTIPSLGKPSEGGNMPAGSIGVVWVNVGFDRKEDIPTELLHQISYSASTAGDKVEELTSQAAPLAVSQEKPIVLAPPLRGGKWVACGGYNSSLGHRRSLFPMDNTLKDAQRYAIDWLLINDNGQSFEGDPKVVTNAAAYGRPVYAVADGTIVGVVDKFPDQVPPTPSGDRNFPGGNSITIDIGNGAYAFYAHLKPHSMKVHEGDKVTRGQVIALLGNSGNSTGPHLHFHVTNSPSPLGADGIPYVFDSFQLLGEIDVDKFFADDQQAAVQHIDESQFAGTHANELPRSGDVVAFPQGN